MSKLPVWLLVGSAIFLLGGWLLFGTGWPSSAIFIAWAVAFGLGMAYARADSAYRHKVALLLRAQRAAWGGASDANGRSGADSGDVPQRFAEENSQLRECAKTIEAARGSSGNLAERTLQAIDARGRWNSIAERVSAQAATPEERAYAQALLARRDYRDGAHENATRAAESSLRVLLQELERLEPPRLRVSRHQQLIAEYRRYLDAVSDYHRADAQSDRDGVVRTANIIQKTRLRITDMESELFPPRTKHAGAP